MFASKYRRLIAGALLAITLGLNLHPYTIDKPPRHVDKTYLGNYPAVYIPKRMRQENWLGPKREGSCVHAAMTNLFIAQGRFKLANWWRTHNGDGEWPSDLAPKLDAAGIKYAYTSMKGNVKFLEWAVKTHRGCGVTVRGASHMVVLVHLDKKWAGLLDSNAVDEIIWVPRKTFIAEWLNSESWAITPVYTPQPPMPTVIR